MIADTDGRLHHIVVTCGNSLKVDVHLHAAHLEEELGKGETLTGSVGVDDTDTDARLHHVVGGNISRMDMPTGKYDSNVNVCFFSTLHVPLTLVLVLVRMPAPCFR
jgi:hypothetical protein